MRRLFSIKKMLQDFGGATVEFVIVFPIFIVIFVSTFESGMIFVRQVMFERGLDIAMRELRLGTGSVITHTSLKEKICENAGILPNCETNMVLELNHIDMDTFDTPTNNTPCVDIVNNVTPNTNFTNGGENDLMVVRACYTVPIFAPVWGLGLALADSGDGTLQLVARSAYVTEPL